MFVPMQHHTATELWDSQKLCCSAWILHWRCRWVSAFHCAVSLIAKLCPGMLCYMLTCIISFLHLIAVLFVVAGILPRFYMSHVSRTSSPSWWFSSAARTISGTLILLPSWWRCYLSPTRLYSLVLSDSLKWWRTICCQSNSWCLPWWSSTLVGSACQVIVKI